VTLGRLGGATAASLAGISLLLAGCGEAGQASACADIVGVLADGADTLRNLAENPAEARTELAQLADELRSAGEAAGGAVRDAAGALADGYDAIAAGIDSGDLPDIEVLTDPTTALADACRP
jgi:ABC-type transporter Mla subunit MlaD